MTQTHSRQPLGVNVWQRMEDAVLKVRRRLELASNALLSANIPFAIVGGNAVAAWVATIDEAAVRSTRDVDLMVRREDLIRTRVALESAGLHYRHTAGMDIFLDEPDGKARDAVHVVFAGEFVRLHEPRPNPEVEAVVLLNGMPTLALEALVEIKLTAWRDKDRTHLRDLIEVGLLDKEWVDKLPEILRPRLRQLLEDPEG